MKQIDYKTKYKEQLKQNLENFDIKDKKTIQKIKKFCEKFNFIQEEVETSIKNNIFLKVWFILEPLKQNFYEKVFGDFLKNDIKNISKVCKLEDVFIKKQKIVQKKEINQYTSSKGKSIDFSFKYKDFEVMFYVFHKYTKESGGSQDNQKNDVKISIEEAKTDTKEYNENIMVLFVCDGEYYNEYKMQELKKTATQDNLKVLKSNELQSFLDGFGMNNKKHTINF
ncbi:hypothetical protein [Candidatus Phytoplasma meliae]|uniref:Restriction endonuclease type IV Mrr domain-containing protein n=1 Tax=Candidatus Phytoplasma meliae TaxID=1848402 RepID=A0ABS5CXY0_9MOLU|nr:hypothetical protein [Candidatus Phytoplasma meliae]MBP5835829.1 hypothetical protein [Candidatus Phytoplasma meliae]